MPPGSFVLCKGWLWNFRRYLLSVPVAERVNVAVGTTANEQLHHELNASWDNVHGIHRAPLEMKLGIFKMAKLLAHNRAMYHPALRQNSQKLVLNRVVPTLTPWTDQTWTDWTSQEVEDSGVVRSARLNKSGQRHEQAVSYHTWKVAKRPSASPKAAMIRKRTPFSKKTGFKRLLQAGRERMRQAAKARGEPEAAQSSAKAKAQRLR